MHNECSMFPSPHSVNRISCQKNNQYCLMFVGFLKRKMNAAPRFRVRLGVMSGELSYDAMALFCSLARRPSMIIRAQDGCTTFCSPGHKMQWQPVLARPLTAEGGSTTKNLYHPSFCVNHIFKHSLALTLGACPRVTPVLVRKACSV